MSKHDVAEFWRRVQQDEKLGKRIDAIPDGPAAETAAALARIGAELGLSFTSEELAPRSPAELKDGDLDRVAGGSFQSNYHTSKFGLLSDERTSHYGSGGGEGMGARLSQRFSKFGLHG